MGEARIALVHSGFCSGPCRSHAAGSVGRWPSGVSALRTILLGASSRVRDGTKLSYFLVFKVRVSRRFVRYKCMYK